MRMRWVAVGASIVVMSAWSATSAHEHDVPAGPIRDRHELMEGIGKNAKVIGDGLKSGDRSRIPTAAEKIQAAAPKIPGVFPPGSTHPKSRAKPGIWTHWAKFEEGTKQLEAKAAALATAAKNGGDVKAGADALFGTCKSCHDEFRVPEKKKH